VGLVFALFNYILRQRLATSFILLLLLFLVSIIKPHISAALSTCHRTQVRDMMIVRDISRADISVNFKYLMAVRSTVMAHFASELCEALLY